MPNLNTIFPASSFTATGTKYTERNILTGVFENAKISDIKPIESKRNSSCFGVIEISVPDQLGVFHLYLNLTKDNGEKERKGLEYLVHMVKDLQASAGEEPTLEKEEGMDFVINTLQRIWDEGKTFTILQTNGEKGLDIKFVK